MTIVYIKRMRHYTSLYVTVRHTALLHPQQDASILIAAKMDLRFRNITSINAVNLGQVVEKRTIGGAQAKIIKLTITLNNFITLEDQLIPSI